MAKVVVIDDSSSVRQHLRDVLVSAGHEVVEAADGKEGFAQLTTVSNIDLVISDYNMTGYDGIIMLQKTREKLGAIPFPIIMLTTENTDQLKQAGKQVGVVAWIVKPFVPQILLSAITKLLSNKKGAS